jgi:hypothetical protein
MNYDLSLIFQQLSATLQRRFDSVTITEILSSLQSLSGVPIHPYERLKYDLFGKNYVFKTINDIEAPKDFNVETYTQQLTGITEQTHQMSLSSLSAFNASMQTGTLTAEMPLLPPDTIRHNLEFVEIVKSISLDEVQRNPVQVAQKLTSYYIKNFK